MLISAHDGYPRWVDSDADLIEVDVRRDARGRLILAHDEPAPGADRPPLDAVLRAAAAVQLDLKESGYEHEIVEQALQHLPADRIVITTGMDDSVKTIKDRFPHVRAGLTLAEKLTQWTWGRIERCHANFVALDHRYADFYARQPLRVWLWTVDDDALLRRYLDEGWPEALITNRPDVALRLRKARA